MQTFKLNLIANHLFVEISGNQWLVDTGSPSSFGAISSLEIGGAHFAISDSFMGMLNANSITKIINTPVTGLIGLDILAKFDIELDVKSEKISFSPEPIEAMGHKFDLENFMGAPILKLQSGTRTHRMFFDTGSQISFLQPDDLINHPQAGDVVDFYPGFGEFTTATHQVPFQLNPINLTLRCGTLPELLNGMLLRMANVDGIVGHELCWNHKITYSARRQHLVLA